jgi:hypothetical protein
VGYVERRVEGPNGKREELTGNGPWRARKGWCLVSERRSAIDERADAVRPLRAKLEDVIVPLLRAGSIPQPQAWSELLADDLLDAMTVGAALASLGVPQPDGIVCDTVAVAANSATRTTKTKTPIDVALDAVCMSIRKALSKDPNGLMLKALVGRCGGSQKKTTIKTRLRLLKTRGHVMQTGNRGAYKLTDKGAKQQRQD